MFVRQVAAVRDVAVLIPECHDVMWSGLRTFVLCILLGGSGMAAADVEPAADSASLNSALARPTLRQAEIFLPVATREIQLGQGFVERRRPIA